MGNKAAKPSVVNVQGVVASQQAQEVVKESDSAVERGVFDYIVTSIEVVETGDVEDTETYGEGAKYVEFDGKIRAEKDDNDVVFLLNPRQTESSTKDNVMFTAISVSQETFVKKLLGENKKILACVHGFTVEPESWIKDCAKIQENEAFEHLVLPIIWPSNGDRLTILLQYDTEQIIALQAGKALQGISDLGKHVPLSVMCHSMGNRVLLSYAKHGIVEKRFENVFMVAADVWEECFNTRCIEDTWYQPPWNYWNLWKDSGLKLSQMLKDGGKIHVINYSGDRALAASQYGENWRTRLGRYGLAAQQKEGRVHPDVVEKLVGYDMGEFEDEVKEADGLVLHSYHAMPKLAEYYNTIMNRE